MRIIVENDSHYHLVIRVKINMKQIVVKATLIALILVLGIPTAGAAKSDRLYRSVLHTLDYIAVDYPASVKDGQVVDQGEYAEQQEMIVRLQGLFASLPARPGKDQALADLAALRLAIERRDPAAKVQAGCRALGASILAGWPVNSAPRTVPAMDQVAAVYQQHCSGCHGAGGHGDGAMAAGLEPAPANFHDRQRQRQLSLFGLFNTITLGVEGTAMRAFSELDDQQRWALAFYISGFAADVDSEQRGQMAWQDGKFGGQLPDLSTLVLTTPDGARQHWGQAGVDVLSYLRRHPQAIAASATPIDQTRGLLAQSLALYRHGNGKGAYDKAIAAYLDGFEPAEKRLDAVAPALRRQVETAMRHYREGLDSPANAQQVEQHYQTLAGLLGQTADILETADASPWAAFITALVILLREGMEAILVLAAIYAMLVQAGRRNALRYIHAGWAGALLFGMLTWFAASRVIQIDGADRELTEGLIALITAVMLLYVGFWLHSKASSRQWQQYIHGRLSRHIGQGALWGLGLIAFLAVYREVFESVLFYQSLWLQTANTGHNAILAGGLVATVVLVLIAWLVFRYSLRLPVRLFFQVNAVILFFLALVFTGKGIAALQEAGIVSLEPVAFPEIDVLGIYATAESLAVQLLLILLAVAWLFYSRLRQRGQAA